MLWVRLFPSLTSSLIRASVVLSTGCRIWATSAASEGTSGSPAPIRVASCLVITASSWSPTFLKRWIAPLRAAVSFRFRSAVSAISTGKTSVSRSF